MLKSKEKPKQVPGPKKIKRKFGYDIDDDSGEIETTRKKVQMLTIIDEIDNDNSRCDAPSAINTTSIDVETDQHTIRDMSIDDNKTTSVEKLLN